MKKLDLLGQRFGRLVVIEYAGHIGKKQDRAWLCQCDCGKTKIITGGNLVSGRSKSCGCGQKEAASKIRKTHGFSKTRLYHIYKGMKARCNNPQNPAYKHYGGRGIKLCNEWASDFLAFRSWSIKNGYKEDLLGLKCSIDRIDPNKNYSPDNCRWVTMKIQANNTTANTYITINNEKLTVAQWAEKNGLNYSTIYTAMYRFLEHLDINANSVSNIDISFTMR